MPANRGTNRKPQRPRRTHNLGGCETCRRRHVKCDQARPECNVCRKANLECGGFPSPIRWASLSTGPTPSKTSNIPKPTVATRRHSRKFSDNHTATIVRNELQDSGSNVADNDVDGRREDMGYQSSLAFSNQINSNLRDNGTLEIDDADSLVAPVMDQTGIEYSFNADESVPMSANMVDPMVDWNWLFDVSSGLGWNDLFDSATPLPMLSITDPMLGTLMEPGFQVPGQAWDRDTPATIQEDSSAFNQPQHWQANALEPTNTISNPLLSSAVSNEVDEVAVLEDAKILLRHFREVVIPKFSPVPMTSKSPWEIMHWRAAVQTHADLTYLGGSNVSYASKANLFAVLGCSAYDLIGMRVNVHSGGLLIPRAREILDYSCKRARTDMQESLRVEVTGSLKAKYKDQLMGITSLIALTTLMGMTTNARCYLIDAERLLRLRGLAKREVSRRARLLHHVYTWLRIIGESTFVLHDHKNDSLQSRIENMLSSNGGVPGLSPTSDRSKNTTGESSELDDFLRIETHAPESDTDLESSKDQGSGLRDIHLADVRQWPQTLYMEVYGIPEIWLSLVSQVTRIANVMDFLRTSSIPMPPAFNSSLHRKLSRLEHRICSFSAEYSVIAAPSRSHSNDTNKLTSSMPTIAHQAMLRAMSSALVIFFYRRIRKVHPWILQSHVSDVITALKEFGDSKEPTSPSTSGTVGTPWPAFIAGCEAMLPESRQWLSKWIEDAANQSMSSGFIGSQEVMQKVWEQRDASNKSNKGEAVGSGKEGELYSWIDVLREEKLWLMLY